MVQSVNISEGELEQINQFLITLENIVNEGKQWEMETIIEGEGLEGVIQAFLSMIMTNFDQALAKFRVYPRFIKKLENGNVFVWLGEKDVKPWSDPDVLKEYKNYLEGCKKK